MPVLVLKEVACKHPNFRITGVRCKLDDLLGIATLEQALDAFDFFVTHRVEFGC